MAEKESDEKLTLDLSEPATELPPRKRILPKRSFVIKDKDAFVKYILDGLKQDLQDREARMQRRMARMEKLHGWLPVKSFPWENCANYSVPTMRIADLKMRGTLENALKSVRPMMNAKSKQRRNSGKEETVDNVLDFQFYVENQGETIIDNLVCHFCEDEAVFATVRYVKETQTFHDQRILPPLDPAQSTEAQLLTYIKTIYDDQNPIVSMTDSKGYEWEVDYIDRDNKPRASRCCFYEFDDGRIQACLVTKAETHDGPCVQIENFEDIVFPVRSANLQPPTDTNPDGAPYYNKLFNFNLDVCRRRILDGTYNQIDRGLEGKDWEKIEASSTVAGTGDESDEPKQQQDRLEGVDLSAANKREDRQGVIHYGRYDVDGDGLEEDIVAWIARDAAVLLKVELLTEVFPVIPIRRPIVHDAFVPNPNRVYGMSQAELLEQLEDAMTVMLNQHVDYGTLTNTPFGVMRAASNLKPENIYLEPGLILQLDDVNDLQFPTMPQKDSAFALNTMAVLQQFVERIQMAGDTSYGRVPQGKASALRTMGTTMALLAPSDERSEMVLRRLFGLFSGIYQYFHALNRRYLPKQKEIRMVGMSQEGSGAYTTIQNGSEDVDYEVDFEFKGSMINANKQVVSQELSEAMAILVSPLAVQAGFISMVQLYNLFRDKLKALNLDPDTYLKRPPNPMPGPPILAEEVVSAILDNETPVGHPMEPTQEHMQSLMAFVQSDAFGLLNPSQVQVFKMWMMKLQALMQQELILQAAAGAMQGGGPPQQQQGPGQPTTVSSQGTGTADNQMLQGNQNIDESVAPPGMQ